jgi:hypothetical protein
VLLILCARYTLLLLHQLAAPLHPTPATHPVNPAAPAPPRLQRRDPINFAALLCREAQKSTLCRASLLPPSSPVINTEPSSPSRPHHRRRLSVVAIHLRRSEPPSPATSAHPSRRRQRHLLQRRNKEIEEKEEEPRAGSENARKKKEENEEKLEEKSKGQGAKTGKERKRKKKKIKIKVNWALTIDPIQPKPNLIWAPKLHPGPRPKLYSSINFGFSLFIGPIRFELPEESKAQLKWAPATSKDGSDYDPPSPVRHS